MSIMTYLVNGNSACSKPVKANDKENKTITDPLWGEATGDR